MATKGQRRSPDPIFGRNRDRRKENADQYVMAQIFVDVSSVASSMKAPTLCVRGVGAQNGREKWIQRKKSDKIVEFHLLYTVSGALNQIRVRGSACTVAWVARPAWWRTIGRAATTDAERIRGHAALHDLPSGITVSVWECDAWSWANCRCDTCCSTPIFIKLAKCAQNACNIIQI